MQTTYSLFLLLITQSEPQLKQTVHEEDTTAETVYTRGRQTIVPELKLAWSVIGLLVRAWLCPPS